MSVSHALQVAVRSLLLDAVAVTDIVGMRIFDNVPADAAFPYISFGASDYVPVRADCIPSREETIQIDVWCRDQGAKSPCRRLVDAIVLALDDAEPVLEAGALVAMSVELVRVLDDPDGITAHGVVQITATIEESR